MKQTLSNAEWTLLDINGHTAVTFTSFIDIKVSTQGQAVSYPLEEGGFVNYNKTHNPLDIKLTLGAQGTETDFSYTLQKLDELQERAATLAVVTPSAVYENMTLESYDTDRGPERGARMLIVVLSLKEVRPVEALTSATGFVRPKNPTSAGRIGRGREQAEGETEGESDPVLEDAVK